MIRKKETFLTVTRITHYGISTLGQRNSMHILKRQRHTELRGSLSLQRDDAADGLGKVTGVVLALVSMASTNQGKVLF